jgi:hypothetical protein
LDGCIIIDFIVPCQGIMMARAFAPLTIEAMRQTLTEDINAAGFSDALPPDLAPVIGHLELLARPRSRKAKAGRKRPTKRKGSRP